MPDRPHDHRAAESSRSRSPARPGHRAHRTRSPHRHGRRRHNHSPAKDTTPKELPFASRQISKRDYVLFRPMFALYLDIQKQRVLDDMDDMEAKGRWKSFIGKWNRGALSEGWYDPSTLQKATTASSPIPSRGRPPQPPPPPPAPSPKKKQKQKQKVPQQKGAPREADPESDSTSTDTDTSSIGPSLPGKGSKISSIHPSTHPSRHLNNNDGDDDDDDDAINLLPPSTHAHAHRQESRSLLRSKLNSFAEAKNPGMVEEVDDRVLFEGEGEGGGEEFDVMGNGKGDGNGKSEEGEKERKKGEREVRREEVMRMRREEREERLGEYRRREEETMGMLREMARQRFGQGGGDGGGGGV